MEKADKVFWVKALGWSTAGLAALLAFVAWGEANQWQVWPISTYQLFPLFGLMAFGLMWSHYIAGFGRQAAGLDKPVLARYFKLTSAAVLALILLHPGLLVYQRFRDGYGLPPDSYTSYVAPGLSWVAMLGAISLLVFLAFELHRVLGHKSWWQYIADASDLAMLAIFYHGLRLGGVLMSSWFRYVWWFCGITLILVLLHKYYLRFAGKEKARS